MNSIQLIYFSPTHTTEEITSEITKGIGFPVQVDNITHSKMKFDKAMPHESLLVIGVPVYSGRIPELVYERLDGINGKGRSAIAVVVYGNRAYDDALLELKSFLVEKGFNIIAASAFIGEHSYSIRSLPIAAGRPDDKDLKDARRFGELIKAKISKGNQKEKEINSPGNIPYKERKPSSRITPVTDASICVKCMECIGACPTGAIMMNDPFVTDPELCIRCAACIKVCSFGAREFKDPVMIGVSIKLHETCGERREPEYFI